MIVWFIKEFCGVFFPVYFIINFVLFLLFFCYTCIYVHFVLFHL